MIDQDKIDRVVERLITKIESSNTYILNEIAKSINEIGTINSTKRQQLIQILKYGGNYEKIVKKIAQITQTNVKEIYDIFEEIAKSDYKFAKQFYDYRGINYIPYQDNMALRQQVRALATITAQEYLNISRTSALGFALINKDTGSVTIRGLQDTYYNLIDEAVLSISQGKETFEGAMYRQLKNVAESGLKVVYPSGRAVRLDSAMRMNMESALGNLHNTIQEQIGREFGADGVEISVHLNPAIDHEEVQGKQFSYAQYNNLQTSGVATTYDGEEIDMYIGEHFRPISELNCKHKAFSIVLGVNKPQYSKKQLKEIIDKNNKGFEFEGKHYTNYEGTQLQRRIETEIRRKKEVQKPLEVCGFDTQDIKKSLRILRQKYKDLAKISGLPTMPERFKVV